jgi:hypothetical protein
VSFLGDRNRTTLTIAIVAQGFGNMYVSHSLRIRIVFHNVKD